MLVGSSCASAACIHYEKKFPLGKKPQNSPLTLESPVEISTKVLLGEWKLGLHTGVPRKLCLEFII